MFKMRVKEKQLSSVIDSNMFILLLFQQIVVQFRYSECPNRNFYLFFYYRYILLDTQQIGNKDHKWSNKIFSDLNNSVWIYTRIKTCKLRI